MTAPEYLVASIAGIYSATFSAGLALLLLTESLAPLVSFGSYAERARHVLRNFALWILALIFAEGLVGAGLLRIPERLYETPPGAMFGVSIPFLPWLVIGILILDFGQFVFHRLAHLARWLWLVHAVHHSDIDSTPTPPA